MMKTRAGDGFYFDAVKSRTNLSDNIMGTPINGCPYSVCTVNTVICEKATFKAFGSQALVVQEQGIRHYLTCYSIDINLDRRQPSH